VGRKAPDLAKLAAEQFAAYLKLVPVGSPLPINSSSDLCYTLELLVPEVLRREHPEWGGESIDGFFFSTSMKKDEASGELAGTCILISDQTVTPFVLNLTLSDRQGFASFRIRLGEAGNGPLGISGPDCNSRAARDLLLGLDARLQQIDWVYDVAT
jgi:hypothetical protein